MKDLKLFLLTGLIIITYSTPLIGQDKMDFYLGGGISFNNELFNIDDDDIDEDFFNFDNSIGINTCFGKSMNENLSLEFGIDYLFGFESDYSSNRYGSNTLIKAEMDLDVQTFIGLAKYSLAANGFKPYLIAGFGFMRSSMDVTVIGKVNDIVVASTNKSDSFSSLCSKIGGGVEYPLQNNISFKFEGAYVKGFGDNDGLDYLTILIGGNYYFSL